MGTLIPTPPCQTVWQYQAVFTGTVTEVINPGLPILKPGERPPSFENYPQQQVTFKISENFNGLEPGTKQITIVTGLGGGDCGYRFERGVEYIVYGYRNPKGQLGTGICSPTRPVTAAAADLSYLRSLPDRSNPGEIRTTTVDMSRTWRARAAGARDYVGLSDAKVSIEGKAIRRTAGSDGSGRSIFSNLEPGEYKLSVALEGYTLSSEVPPVKLHAKGCAEVMLPVQIDHIVTGKVVTSDGLPATGVEIEALPFRPRNENDHPTPADSSTTDKNGRYVLRNLQAGDYYLGVSLGRSPSNESPYTRWFFPGTEDPAAAVLVHMYDKPGELTFDLTLPDRQKPRVIEGTVVWPDGRPAAEVRIKLEDPRWPWQVASDWK